MRARWKIGGSVIRIWIMHYKKNDSIMYTPFITEDCNVIYTQGWVVRRDKFKWNYTVVGWLVGGYIGGNFHIVIL